MKNLIIPCPKCDSINTEIKLSTWKWAKCNECGYEERDYLIGGQENCRCPTCLSNDVKIQTISAQSGNTDWEVFSCNKCGCESGLIDDQKYKSDCYWYDSSKYDWIREINWQAIM